MNSIPHRYLLASLLTIAIVLFVSSLVSMGLAFRNSSEEVTPSPQALALKTSLPTPFISPQPLSGNKQTILTASAVGFIDNDLNLDNQGIAKIGRDSETITQGFLGFDLTTIDNKQNLESATLKVYQSKITGNPYSLGNLYLSSIQLPNGIESLKFTQETNGLLILSRDENLEWKNLDVTQFVKQNTTKELYFRIYFSKQVKSVTTLGDFVELGPAAQLIFDFD